MVRSSVTCYGVGRLDRGWFWGLTGLGDWFGWRFCGCGQSYLVYSSATGTLRAYKTVYHPAVNMALKYVFGYNVAFAQVSTGGSVVTLTI
jgi:hypothetical protein